jgi:DnaJ-class molecular chaperone
MPTTTPHDHPPTYYDILSLSPSTLSSSSADPTTLIKRAYRRALLSHHPDKSNPHSSSNTTAATRFTIDQISTAYATLSRPAQRTAYDRSLVLAQQTATTTTKGTQSNFQTGIETVDLDDLAYEDVEGEGEGDGEESTTTRWYRSCRCGNPRGYLFNEADLEEAADLGELMLGCADCSLWLRVHFAVVDEDESGDQGRHGGEAASRQTTGAAAEAGAGSG